MLSRHQEDRRLELEEESLMGYTSLAGGERESNMWAKVSRLSYWPAYLEDSMLQTRCKAMGPCQTGHRDGHTHTSVSGILRTIERILFRNTG